ncbi:hypothetical protein [Aeromicrobium sp. CTD01-1L150]|uniref:hypothetical protein n=1 Tax=Aeromicrobium sp. CTD01-1L150 TaxID=3341830 RepID=UPI0035C16EAD
MANRIEWAHTSQGFDYTGTPGDYAYDGSHNDGPAVSLGEGVVLEADSVPELLGFLNSIVTSINDQQER